jgi:TRAP-type C4-dicarboxylate transport system permease small subunit
MLAQVNLGPTSAEFENLGGLTFGQIVGGLVNMILLIAAIIFFFILVWGGIRWITSGGDKANTEAARNQITAALVGLVIVFAAWAILQLLEAFFGITLLGDINIPTIQ